MKRDEALPLLMAEVGDPDLVVFAAWAIEAHGLAVVEQLAVIAVEEGARPGANLTRVELFREALLDLDYSRRPFCQ